MLDQDSCLIIAGFISDVNYPLGIEIRRQVEAMRYRELLEILDRLIGAKSP
jgi:hypothetical protein